MTPASTRVLAVGGLCLTMTAITVGGSALPVREPSPVPLVASDGRTVTVCPPAPAVFVSSATAWGALGVRSIDDSQAQPVPPGQGAGLTDIDQPVVMVAEGRQTQGAAASAYAREAGGSGRGVAVARCGTPATSSWFTGLVSDPGGPQGVRSEISLINPDARAADVDLILFGPTGLQSASGARGITVPARSVRTVALESLFTRAEPVGVQVRANTGRVAAVAKQYATAGAQPAGTDWQVEASAPATHQIVPGIPGGPGSRILVISNPGSRRTTAAIEVLASDGTFTPADAGTVDVGGESTAAVGLEQGLDGDPGAVRIASDQPLIASVVSRSSEAAATSDIAGQPATEPLGATGMAAVAGAPGVSGTLLVSNGGDTDAAIGITLVGVDGGALQVSEVRIAPGSTLDWAIDPVDEPVALHVRPSGNARLHAGIVLTSENDPRAGLATTPLSVPGQDPGGAVAPVHDPDTGR